MNTQISIFIRITNPPQCKSLMASFTYEVSFWVSLHHPAPQKGHTPSNQSHTEMPYQRKLQKTPCRCSDRSGCSRLLFLHIYRVWTHTLSSRASWDKKNLLWSTILKATNYWWRLITPNTGQSSLLQLDACTGEKMLEEEKGKSAVDAWASCQHLQEYGCS